LGFADVWIRPTGTCSYFDVNNNYELIIDV
jgi:hypothetical protein